MEWNARKMRSLLVSLAIKQEDPDLLHALENTVIIHLKEDAMTYLKCVARDHWTEDCDDWNYVEDLLYEAIREQFSDDMIRPETDREKTLCWLLENNAPDFVRNELKM